MRSFCLCKLSIGFHVPFWRLMSAPDGRAARADGVGNAETGNMLLDEILAFEMRDARLLVGIGDGRIDQMPDAGRLRRFRGNDSLTGLFLGPGLVAVAHQKHGAE